MSNQWGRLPHGLMRQNIGALILGFVIFSIIGYLLLPKFSRNIYSFINPTVTATSLNNVNSPSTYNPSALNSSAYSIQNSPTTYNMNSENGRNDVTTGYWILFVSNGKFTQLSINIDVTTFVQRLIESDRKGTAINKIFLIDNGRIRQYMVSNEIYSIISNMSTVDSRALNASSNSSPNASINSSPNASVNLNPNASVNSSPNTSANSSSNVSPNSSSNFYQNSTPK